MSEPKIGEYFRNRSYDGHPVCLMTADGVIEVDVIGTLNKQQDELTRQQEEIARLREENARLKKPDFLSVLAYEAGYKAAIQDTDSVPDKES